ncbi:MAG TPA: alpha-ketoacid dehydrogenase subunit beta, partial [Mycobacterium sp.]|nr:alpha-ketoacid dehydrogenase subunit beta [Mycobacterium sp.]
MTATFARPPAAENPGVAAELTMVAAINRALRDVMAADDRVLV